MAAGYPNYSEEDIQKLSKLMYANYQNTSPNFNPLWSEYTEVNTPSFIVFFGFNGMLAKKYSKVESMTEDEVSTRLQFAGNKVPYSIKNPTEFKIVIKELEGTPNALVEIPFDDALNVIRIGIDNTKVEEFEDAEVDEFTENCVEACKPGNHKCK